MNFKINLKPYPAAPYFTAEGHARAYDASLQKSEEDVVVSERLMREFFGISGGFKLTLHQLYRKEEVLRNFEALIIRDDPTAGMVRNGDKIAESAKSAVIDLSYSFPQTISNLSRYDAVFADPNMSLGIPADFFLLFSKADDRKSNNVFPRENFGKQVFVLRKVLEDYLDKGLEMLLREMNYKAAVLYQLIESSKLFAPNVKKEDRSKTVISAICEKNVLSEIRNMGYELNHSAFEGKVIISLANYATQSKESVEMFSDRISAL